MQPSNQILEADRRGTQAFQSDVVLDIGHFVKKTGTYYIKNGEFSDVWEGVYEPSGNSPIRVAIKVLRGAPSHNTDLHEQTKEKLRKAGTVWIMLKDRNVLPFLGISYEFGYLPSMISPWCDNGSILEYIKSTCGAVDVLRLLRDVAGGLSYLHAMGIVHGDIRAANILVSDKGEAMLCDYGVTFIIDHGEFTTNKIAGPARWTPPEILDPPDGRENDPPYSVKSDIFSFAMTAVEICDGKPPYNKVKNDSAVIFHILKGNRPEIPSLLGERKQTQEIIEKCWDKNLSNRPTAAAVLKIFECALSTRDAGGGWALPNYVYSTVTTIFNWLTRGWM